MGMSTGAVVGVVAGVVVVGGGVTYLVLRQRRRRFAPTSAGNPPLAQSRQDVAAAVTQLGPAVVARVNSPGVVESLANQYFPGSGKLANAVASKSLGAAKSVAKKLKFW